MASIYSQIEEKIKNAQEEIRHLESERMALRRAEKDMPRDSYIREDASIRDHIAAQEEIVRQNQELLTAYNNARSGIVDLRTLRDLLDRERDPQIRREITEEIEAKERQVQEARTHMSEEFQQELRDSIDQEFNVEEQKEVNNDEMVLINPNPQYTEVKEQAGPVVEETDKHVVEDTDEMVLINPNPQFTAQEAQREETTEERLERLRRENAEARRVYRESIDRMQEIYAGEQQRFEEGEWAMQPEGFDGFVEEYIGKMEVENARYIRAQEQMEATQREIDRLELEVERVRQEQEARALNISVEDYERIVSAVSKRSVYAKVLEQQGLGEILHKRGGRSRAEKEAIDAAKEEIVTRLAEVQSRTEGQIDIKETIDMLYGTDLTASRAGRARETTLTEAEIGNIGRQAERAPKRLIKDPTYRPDYVPGAAPTDVPRIEARERPLGLPAGETVLALPAAGESSYGKGINPLGEENVYGYTPEDYHMTQEAWDDYIAEGFTPGTDHFDWAVILDGTGIIPERRKAEGKTEPPIQNTEPPKQKKRKPRKRKTTEPPVVKTDPPLTEPPVVKTDPPKTEPPIAITDPPKTDPPIVITEPPKTDPPVVKTEPPKTEPPVVRTDPPRTEPPVVRTDPPRTEPPVVRTDPPAEKPKVGLMEIMYKLTEGLEITKKDGKAYRASNIKVAKNFRDELHSGNYLYNIVHFVPALIKVPFQFLSKLVGKIRYNKESKKRMKILKERIANLTEEELMVIYKEYRGNRVVQERFPSAINILLEERIQEFVMSKVAALNAQLERDYAEIYGVIKQLDAIDAQLRSNSITPEERQKLEEYKAQLLQGRAQQVKRIRDTYIEAENWLSGGLHGFTEDMKASATKLSIIGMRFAKDHDLDLELLKKQAQLERAENKAIADGNDEMALRIFVQAETVLSQETQISNSLAGRRSTGKKYYSPLAEQLDYRDDPFVRDLFTTVAVAAATFNIANTIKQQQEIAQANAEIAQANQQLGDAQNLVDKINGEQDTFREGMQGQAIQNTSNVTGQVERGALDSTNWGLGTNAYRAADNAGHSFYNQFYGDTQSAINNVTQQYASGAISQTQALEMMRDIANGTQSTLGNVSQQCIQIFESYAKTHPQFDLTAVTEAVRYIAQNPQAVANMNNAVVDISSMANGLSFTQIQALQSLPSDMFVSLVGAASVAAMATQISNTMSQNVRKGKYGNSVTAMVDEYADEQEALRQQQDNQRQM